MLDLKQIEETLKEKEFKNAHENSSCKKCDQYCCSCELCDCCNTYNWTILKDLVLSIATEAFNQGVSDVVGCLPEQLPEMNTMVGSASTIEYYEAYGFNAARAEFLNSLKDKGLI